ncbi:hypothetical protein FPOAC2_10511 [Fusarium poae]|jgi:hypothetical protein|uniref:Fungal N-terminal domain-containing protein n=1 Tax=Fusarium poae TaxID=36050 RepID=A0A1B8AB85_FUSPO|nr:hypothetical protein FPOAC1_010236 [Fusarium poae]KAG8665440.1 hypothetical protein FPOAC1_010236 [Fusarium poae]OBS17741.1 hypothetical protein FPOA_09473 [Fusarium poae]
MPSALQADMDPLAVVGLPTTTAITGLLEVGAAAIDILSDLNISPQHDTLVLNALVREVKECRSSVHAFYKTLNLIENGQIPIPARAAWISLETLVATLTDTVLAFSRLSSLCCAVDEESTRSSPEDAAKHFEKRIRALCARIRWHNLSIAMMMTIVNCPGEKDAKNSRDELAHRVARLLTFNVGLSARLRHTARPASGSSAAKTTVSVTESPEITPVNVGHRPPASSWSTTTSSSSSSPYSGTLANLTTPKALSRIVLPIELRELRDDFEYYTGAAPSQVGSCEFPTGGVLVGTPYNVTSAR